MPPVNITVSVESGSREGTAALLVPLGRGAISRVSVPASPFMSGVEGRRNQSWREKKEGDNTLLWQNKQLLNRWPQTGSFVPLRITSSLLLSRRAPQPDVAATNSSQMLITAAATCGCGVLQERSTWILSSCFFLPLI